MKICIVMQNEDQTAKDGSHSQSARLPCILQWKLLCAEVKILCYTIEVS